MPKQRTLTQLEGDDWGDPTYDSHLVTTCHELRHKPLSEFTVEDLRIMIGQKFSLEYLMPIALTLLDDEPLAERDFYPGDLLCNVLKVGREYYDVNPEHHSMAESLLDRALPMAEDDGVVRDALFKAHMAFKGSI